MQMNGDPKIQNIQRIFSNWTKQARVTVEIEMKEKFFDRSIKQHKTDSSTDVAHLLIQTIK